MKKVRNFLMLVAVAAVSLTACEQPKEKADAAILAESDNQPAAEKGTENTTIEFTERQHDFGLIHQGEMVTHTFTFKNTGKAPLIILDAKASCGCTVPQWTKEPVAPGQTGEIEVKYNGSGSGQIHKTVTVLANTEPAETILEINANVRPIDTNLKGPFKQQ